MSTRVVLSDLYDVASREHIIQYLDETGKAQISLGGRLVPQTVYAADGLTPVALNLGGITYSLLDTSYTLPPTPIRITASQIVVGKSCKLTSVKCVVGSAIALTIYDNQTLAAGTVLFSQTMSAGDEAQIPPGIQAINGLTANFTGTATFDIGVQDAS